MNDLPAGLANRRESNERPGRACTGFFLDLTSRVTTSTDNNDERGLLALAFHPNYASNGFFYLWYTTTATTSKRWIRPPPTLNEKPSNQRMSRMTISDQSMTKTPLCLGAGGAGAVVGV